MKDAKNSIPKTHLTEDGLFLMCPRCKNAKKFTALIQFKTLNGMPQPLRFLNALDEFDDEWRDYNTVICDECSFYLIYGGPWRQVGNESWKSKSVFSHWTQRSKDELLKSIPLDVLEEMLNEKEKGDK